MTLSYRFIDSQSLKNDPAIGALDANGRLKVLPAEYWAQFSQNEMLNFGVSHGIYCIPTVELVAWLREEIEGEPAIEIGSGNGVLAEAVGIPATDSMIQSDPQMRDLYSAADQAVVTYGPNVEKLEAEDAVLAHKPQAVSAAWVTHRYLTHEPWRGGSIYGVREERIVRAARYVFVGNARVHKHKPLLKLPHKVYRYSWLISRVTDAPNFIGVWKKRK